MEQLQRRRQAFRLSIRRHDLDARMNRQRTRLSNHFHSAKCLDFINDLCAFNPSFLFTELSNYISNCQPSEKVPWAFTCCQKLQEWEFYGWPARYEGLPYLLLTIFDQLSEEQRRKLASRPAIETLLQELEKTLDEPRLRDDLFRLTFQLSIYASEQSRFHINFSEERVEAIISRAHNRPSIGSLQVLAAVLVNLEEEDLRGCLKRQIKQLGRSLYKQLQSTQDRHLILQVLASIGLHCSLELQDVSTFRAILDVASGLNFSLVLRFLNIQSNEEWITYGIAEQFLLSCQRKLEGERQIYLFLDSISNICRSENYCDLLLSHIYRTFFAGKLHHFITFDTLFPVSKLIIQFFLQKRPEIQSELLDCAFNIVNMGEFKLSHVDKEDLMLLCSYLTVNNRISEGELLDYIGEPKFKEYWDNYEMNNQIRDDDVEL